MENKHKPSNTNLYSEIDKDVNTLIKESAISPYRTMPKKIGFREIFRNRTELRHIIRRGIPYSFFNSLKNIAPFTETEWADFLELSTKSLQRLKKDERKFKPIYSEKIMEIAEVVNIGIDFFGNFEKFKLWLETPNFAIGNIKPLELLKDSYGIDMLKTELTNSEHGIFI